MGEIASETTTTMSTMDPDDDVNVVSQGALKMRAESEAEKRAVELGIEIVEVKRDGNVLDITIAGDAMEDVVGLAAQQFAYDARVEHGFERGGLDRVINRGCDDNGRWKATWRLLRPV